MNYKGILLWSLFGLYCALYVLLYIAYYFIINSTLSSYSIVSVPAILLPFIILLLFQLVVRIFSGKENKGKTLFIVISTFGFIPVLYLMVLLGINEFKSNFTVEKWLNHPDERVYMVDDLLVDYELKGKTKDEVIRKLGAPSGADYFKEDNNIVYYLGNERGLISIDSEWLVIWLNKSGTVEKYEIKRD